MELKFDERGLIPAIVQDHYTKEVLTLAYMNAESLAITIDERRTCFWGKRRAIFNTSFPSRRTATRTRW